MNRTSPCAARISSHPAISVNVGRRPKIVDRLAFRIVLGDVIGVVILQTRNIDSPFSRTIGIDEVKKRDRNP